MTIFCSQVDGKSAEFRLKIQESPSTRPADNKILLPGVRYVSGTKNGSFTLKVSPCVSPRYANCTFMTNFIAF